MTYHLPSLLIPPLLILSSCTGDWNEDTIFFSPAMADRKLEEQRHELAQAEQELAAAKRQTSSLKRHLAQAKQEKRGHEAQLSSIQERLREAELTNASLDYQIQTGTNSRREMDRKVHEQKLRVQKLSDELAEILENQTY